MLKAGIVGLPNVGKSSLFNALTKANALAANYPFATIEPNVGMAIISDERLDNLDKIYQPKKLTPTTIEYIDIAGLVKGASKGEGLGNQFLAQIREVDAICQVVRYFVDPNVTHVHGRVNPIEDALIIKYELMMSDLEVIEKRLPKLEKQIKTKQSDSITEYETLLVLKESLIKGEDPKQLQLSDEKLKAVKSYNFLSLKPTLYLLNISDDNIQNIKTEPLYQEFLAFAAKEQSEVIAISIKLELDLIALDASDKALFLQEYRLEQSALDELVTKTYKLLGLQTFFTVGTDEVRAWTFKKGMVAPDCAGLIHTDFKKGFIAAEVISYNDFISCGSMENAKAKGKVRIEGKTYQFRDGDIALFRFNV